MDRKIKINIIYSAFYQLLTILIPIITTPYLSRTLGPTKIGEYSYAYSIACYFVMFIMLGLTNYGNRTIAMKKSNKENLSKTFLGIYIMQICMSIIVILFYIIYSLFFSNNIMTWILLIYVISAALDINWFFFGMEKFKLTVSRNTVIKILTTISIFIFVKAQSDIYLYALIMVISILISQCLLWPFVTKDIKFVRIKAKDVTKHIKPNLILFVPVIAISLYKVMDKIMLGYLCSMTEVGFYESSEKVITVPMSLVTALGTVMLPKMSSLVASNDNQKSEKYLKSSLTLSIFLSSSMCFGIMGIANKFVPMFYGEGYEICIVLFQILLPSCIFLAIANVIRTQYLLPNSMDKTFIISSFLGAVVNLILNFILIPRMQSVGAAIGTLFAEATVCIYQLIIIKKRVPVLKYIFNSLPFLISGFIMWCVLLLADRIIIIKNVFFNIFVLIVIGIVCYFITLIVQVKVKKDDVNEKV